MHGNGEDVQKRRMRTGGSRGNYKIAVTGTVTCSREPPDVRQFGRLALSLSCSRTPYGENAGAPQPPRLDFNGELAPKHRYSRTSAVIRGAPGYTIFSRQVPPFQTPAGDLHCHLTFGNPASSRPPDPGIPPSADAGYYLRLVEPRWLCVSRLPGICLYRCPRIVSAWAARQPATLQCPTLNLHTRKTQY